MNILESLVNEAKKKKDQLLAGVAAAPQAATHAIANIGAAPHPVQINTPQVVNKIQNAKYGVLAQGNNRNTVINQLNTAQRQAIPTAIKGFNTLTSETGKQALHFGTQVAGDVAATIKQKEITPTAFTGRNQAGARDYLYGQQTFKPVFGGGKQGLYQSTRDSLLKNKNPILSNPAVAKTLGAADVGYHVINDVPVVGMAAKGIGKGTKLIAPEAARALQSAGKQLLPAAKQVLPVAKQAAVTTLRQTGQGIQQAGKAVASPKALNVKPLPHVSDAEIEAARTYQAVRAGQADGMQVTPRDAANYQSFLKKTKLTPDDVNGHVAAIKARTDYQNTNIRRSGNINTAIKSVKNSVTGIQKHPGGFIQVPGAGALKESYHPKLASARDQFGRIETTKLDELANSPDPATRQAVAAYRGAKGGTEKTGTTVKVYRGGKPFDAKLVDVDGASFSTDKSVADRWRGSYKNGVLEEFNLKPGAKVMKAPKPTGNSDHMTKAGYAMDAYKKGYDAVDLTAHGEKEIRVVNPKALERSTTSPQTPPHPLAEEARKKTGSKNYYHGTAKEFTKFDTGKLSEGNLGKGVYITDNQGAAKYYSMLAKEKHAFRNGELPDRSVGSVLDIAVDKSAKIKNFDTMPSKTDVETAKKAGFDGVNYPDETFKNTEDWPSSIDRSEYPQNPRATMLFDGNKARVNSKPSLTDKLSAPFKNQSGYVANPFAGKGATKQLDTIGRSLTKDDKALNNSLYNAADSTASRMEFGAPKTGTAKAGDIAKSRFGKSIQSIRKHPGGFVKVPGVPDKPIAPELEPIAKLAREYKSADDFVEATKKIQIDSPVGIDYATAKKLYEGVDKTEAAVTQRLKDFHAQAIRASIDRTPPASKPVPAPSRKSVVSSNGSVALSGRDKEIAYISERLKRYEPGSQEHTLIQNRLSEMTKTPSPAAPKLPQSPPKAKPAPAAPEPVTTAGRGGKSLPEYGTKIVPKRDLAFRSTRSIIERQGEHGKVLANELQGARDTEEIYQAHLSKQLPTVRSLKGKNFENFVEATQGKAQAANPQVAKAIQEWQAVHPTIRQRAVDAGLDVGDLGQQYYPHFIDYDKLFKDKNLKNTAINHLVQTGQAKSPEEALKLLSYAKDVSRNRSFGNLEAQRLVDLPMYDKTPNSLVSYLQGSAHRIAQTEHFGAKDEKALKLITDAGGQGYDTEAMKNAYDIAVGAKRYGSTASEFSRKARAFQSTTRLGLGAITNTSQNVNTGIVTGHLRTLGAMAKQLDPKVRSFVADTGVIGDAVLNDIKVQSGFTGKVLGKITAPGFAKVETFNRSVAATAGRDYALRLAQTGKHDVLRKLGVTGEIKGKSLTEAQQVQAARKVVEKTQFKVDAQDLPGWADSPGGKLVAQFRTFSYSQSKFFSNEILKPAAKGDVVPLGRLIAALPLGYALYETKRVINGRPEEENKTKKGLAAFQNIGGAGLAFDIYQSLNPTNSQYLPADRRVSMGVSTIGGPTAGLVAQGIGAVNDLIQRKKTPADGSRLDGKIALGNNGETYTDATQAGRFALNQIPVVGGPIRNRVLPYKKQTEADTGGDTQVTTTKSGGTQKQTLQAAFSSPEGKQFMKLNDTQKKEAAKNDSKTRALYDQYEAMKKGTSTNSDLYAADLSPESTKTLDKYNRLTSKGKDSLYSRDKTAEYQYEKAKFENDDKSGNLSTTERIRRTQELQKSEVGAGYNKEIRDIYSLSKQQVWNYLSKHPDGNRLAQEMVAYGDQLEANDLGDNKFRDSNGNVAIQPKAKGSSGKSLSTLLAEFKLPTDVQIKNRSKAVSLARNAGLAKRS